MQLSNVQLERAMINSLLNQRKGADYALQHLSDDCFYDQQLRIIYHAIREVYASGREVSMISVHEHLQRTQSDYWTSQTLYNLTTVATSSEEPMDIATQLALLTDYAIRRALGPVAMQLLALSTSHTTELRWGIEQVQQGIDHALGCQMQSQFVTLRELLAEARQIATDNLNPATQHTGLLTSIPQLDQEGGMPRGALVVVGGKSSHGKTSFANYLALQTMLHGGHVAYFSMEMSNLELVQRFLAMESGVRSNAIAHLPLYDANYQRVMQAADSLDAAGSDRFYFDRSMRGDFDHMVQQIRTLRRSGQLDLVVLDYLQLLNLGPETRGVTRAQLLAQASHRMKDLCRETGVTIIALSQVNRDCVGIPTSENFLDSSAIKQAADITYILYCAEAEGPKGLDSYPAPFQDCEPRNTALLIRDKGRNNGTLSLLLGFDRKRTRMYPLPDTPVTEQAVVEGEQLELDF